MLLTCVNLLLRFVGTSFQVYLSGRIGAEGIGLLQLVLSVGSMAMVAGMAGIRTATMYLTAEQIGRKKPEGILWVLSGCTGYSIVASTTVAIGVYIFAISALLVTALTAVMILEIPGWLWFSIGLVAVILVLNLKNLVIALLTLLKKRKLHE